MTVHNVNENGPCDCGDALNCADEIKPREVVSTNRRWLRTIYGKKFLFELFHDTEYNQLEYRVQEVEVTVTGRIRVKDSNTYPNPPHRTMCVKLKDFN